jgi:hypothetical protein
MTKLRYVVEREFTAWKPNNPDTRLPIRVGFHVFADLEGDGPVVLFDVDLPEFATNRETFLNSTRPARPDEIKPPTY